MPTSTLVLVHPDPAVLPDDGGPFARMGYRLVIHRDPSASVADLTAPNTVGVLFAAQLDSGLPLQICQITAQGREHPSFPVLFWGPGGDHQHLSQIFNAGAADCFPETLGLEEVAVRMSHRLRRAERHGTGAEAEDLAVAFNKRVRTLAHDLKNPLCVLYGYAQMAQMGHSIGLEEANDMVESSREIREKIDTILAPMASGQQDAQSVPEGAQASA